MATASTTPSSRAKVVYFNGRGRAEAVRWALAAADVPFENEVLKEPADLEALRATAQSATGQVPVVSLDGLNLVQSGAIIRYVAATRGLWGDTAAESAVVDMIVETTRDFANRCTIPMPFALRRGEPFVADVLRPGLDKYLPVFERFIADNAASDTYCVGARVTMADVMVAHVLVSAAEILKQRVSDVLAAHPGVARQVAAVLACPSIAAFLADPTRRMPLGDDAYCGSVDFVLGR